MAGKSESTAWPPAIGAGPPQSASPWRSAMLVSARVAIGVAMVVYLLRADSTRALMSSVPNPLRLLAAVNLITLVGCVAEACRLNALFGALRVVVPVPLTFRLVTVATLFNLWIPGGTGGDVMKLYYLAGAHRGRRVEVATVLLVDRVLALFTLLMLILGLLALQPRLLMSHPLIRALAVAVVVAIVAIAGVWFIAFLVHGTALYRRLLDRLPFGRHVESAMDALHAFRANAVTLLVAGLYCLAGHALLALLFVVAGAFVVPTMPWLEVSSLGLLGLIANVLPVTPGGIGVGEAATEALFRQVGMAGGAVVTLLWRAGTLITCLLGAAFYMYGIERSGRATVVS